MRHFGHPHFGRPEPQPSQRAGCFWFCAIVIGLCAALYIGWVM